LTQNHINIYFHKQSLA